MKEEIIDESAATSAPYVDDDPENGRLKHLFSGLNLAEAFEELKKSGYFDKGSRSNKATVPTASSPPVDSETEQKANGLFFGLHLEEMFKTLGSQAEPGPPRQVAAHFKTVNTPSPEIRLSSVPTADVVASFMNVTGDIQVRTTPDIDALHDGRIRQRIIEELAGKEAARQQAQKPSDTFALITFDLLERFIKACEGRGCHRPTLKSYKSMLRPFAKRFPRLPLDPEVIGGYLADLKKDTTRKQAWKLLGNFYSFISQVEKVPDPMPGVSRPKVKREEKEWCSLNEAARLMAACQTDRERALVDCYLNEGLRLSEPLRLDIRDIGEDLLWLDGKEAGESFPLLAEVRASLLKLCAGRRPEEPVFVNYKGERLGRDTAEEDIRRLFIRAGVYKKRQSPHTLRHTFASLAAEAGCTGYIVKRLLRHATGQDVTDVYTHIRPTGLKTYLERFAPIRLLQRPGEAPGFTTGRSGR